VDKNYSNTAVCTMEFTTGVLYYGTVWPNTPQYRLQLLQHRGFKRRKLCYCKDYRAMRAIYECRSSSPQSQTRVKLNRIFFV